MNLVVRVMSGAVLLALLAAALWIGTPAVAVVITGGALAGAWELAALMSRLGTRPPPWLLLPLTAWLSLRFVFPTAWVTSDWALIAAVVVGLLGMVAAKSRFWAWSAAVAGAVYVGFGLGYWMALFRWRQPDSVHFGLRLAALVLLGAVVGDTVAYLAGSAIGRHPFFAGISPRKTLEGAVAGAAATVLLGALAGPALIGISVPLGAGLGAVMTVAAQGGDLVESAIKREAGVKDSGTLVPGHGGVLDRIDSLVLLAPVVYCYLKLIALT